MNKEYIYHNGEAIIKDENNNQKLVEYYDNLDDVLVQENIIETMENKIKELEKNSKIYKSNKKHYFPYIILSGLLGSMVATILSYVIDNTLLISTTQTIFGTMNKAIFYFTIYLIVALPFTSILEKMNYKVFTDLQKEEKGVNSELEYLKKQIVKEKEKLDNLKKEKSNEKENKEFRVVQVNDIEKLKLLKQYINLYYDLGHNGKKYYKYYQNGSLEQKLKNYYTKEGLKLVEEYLQEKGPTFVKKRKQNDH